MDPTKLLDWLGWLGDKIGDWIRARRRLKVLTQVAWMPTLGPDLLAMIEAVNTGERRVVVNSCGFDVNGHEHGMLPTNSTPRLPATLEDGDNLHVWCPAGTLASDLKGHGYRGVVRLRAWVRDTTGTRHAGDTIRVDLEYAARVGRLPS